MNKNNTPRKLILNKDRIAQLTSREMDSVLGGDGGTTTPPCQPTSYLSTTPANLYATGYGAASNPSITGYAGKTTISYTSGPITYTGNISPTGGGGGVKVSF